MFICPIRTLLGRFQVDRFFDSGAVCGLIWMYSQQLLQHRGTDTAHMNVVHMGTFGTVGTLRVCGHAMPVLGAVVAKFHPVSYGGFIRFSFVFTSVSKAFGCRICFTKVICFSL